MALSRGPRVDWLGRSKSFSSRLACSLVCSRCAWKAAPVARSPPLGSSWAASREFAPRTVERFELMNVKVFEGFKFHLDGGSFGLLQLSVLYQLSSDLP